MLTRSLAASVDLSPDKSDLCNASRQPIVTVICPTMPSRAGFLPWAIACFNAQTYERKRMVVVTDGDIGLPHLGTLGDKRNAACKQATDADYICHFDDDDYSSPDRIADQLAALLNSGKAVTGYHSMRFTDGEKWWKNTNPPSFAFGASLMYRRDWWAKHPFPALNIGEDAAFVAVAVRQRQLLSVDAGEMMHATIHAGNSSKRNVVIGAGWQEISESGF